MSSNPTPKGEVLYINPSGLHNNPAFSQVISVSGPVKTIYVGAHGATDAAGNLVGPGDVKAQTEQALKNIQIALEACGARLEHIIKWSIYITEGQPMQDAFEAAMRFWGKRPNAPANTVMYVSSLVPPVFLIAIEAVAVVPLEAE